jgi:serine/threonine-protein kinase
VFIGTDCSDPGAQAVAEDDGTTAYCSQLQYTDRYLWSASPEEIANVVLTTSPTDTPPRESESPIRLCVEQTHHNRVECAEEILRGTFPDDPAEPESSAEPSP